MPFCIPEEEYDEELHEIVSGPHEACSSCSPLPSLAPLGSFFEISVPLTSLSGSSQETIFFLVSERDTALFVQSQIKRPNSDILFSARIMDGAKEYNSPWQFHLDPSAIGFIAADQADPSRTDLNPSSIEQMMSSGLIVAGSEVYFTHDSRLRETQLQGLSMCEPPLQWACENLVSQTGFNFQVGKCEGECQERYSDGFSEYCLDGFYQQAQDEVTRLLAEIGPVDPPTDEDAIEFFYYMSLSSEDRSAYDSARVAELEYEQYISERSDTEDLQDGI